MLAYYLSNLTACFKTNLKATQKLTIDFNNFFNKSKSTISTNSNTSNNNKEEKKAKSEKIRLISNKTQL